MDTLTPPNRREFLTTLGAGAMTAGLAVPTVAIDDPPPGSAVDKPQTVESITDSPPVLQNPTESSMTIAWAVRAPATGYIEYGADQKLGLRADAPRYGLNPFSDRYLSATITGLKPGQLVHYRTCVVPIKFESAYKIEAGAVQTSPIYQFRLPDPAASKATFSLINDTHQNIETLRSLTQQIADAKDDFVIYDGDVFNDVYTDGQIVEHVLRPAGAAYAAERPLLFVNGNHDHRGPLARRLSLAFTPWAAEEPLGRCFAVRHGPLAIIGLDTGEDKPDRHPIFAGLANFEKYHEAQRDWLVAALKRPAIAAAPFVVLICHIPLCGRPKDNGGDTLEGFAAYARHARDLWHPVLEQAKVQLVISGHTHEYRYDPPTKDHRYAQLVGGGPRPNIATFIRGSATAERLEIVATKLDKKEWGRWTYNPRPVG